MGGGARTSSACTPPTPTADNTHVADGGLAESSEREADDRGVAWALPLLALGLGLIACCLLLPVADENRKLADERSRLAAELEAIERQVETNSDFIDRLHADPQLARRLVYRQRPPEPQEQVATLGDGRGDPRQRFSLSPFALLAADPVVAPPPSVPGGGALATLCRNPRTKLAVLGVGLMCCLLGLLAGGGSSSDASDPSPRRSGE